MDPSTRDPKSDVLSEMVDSCVLMRTRIVSRAITALYDDVLRPFGVNAPQFTLLVVMYAMGPATRVEIGRFNQQTRSTMTRNLQVMVSQGWIEESSDERSGRGRPMILTSAGTKLLRDVAPAWRKAQAQAQAVLGEPGTLAVTQVANGLILSRTLA